MAVKKEPEAPRELVEFTWRGHKLSYGFGKKMSFKAYKAFKANDNTTGIEIALGPEQWALVEPELDVLEDVDSLAAAFLAASDTSPGESSR